MGEPLDSRHVHHRTLDGVATRYLEAGEGDPILLVHGGHFGIFVPMGIEIWSENVEALSRHCRVLAFDKLGQGWTDLPRSDEEWTFDAVVAHARSFVEALDLSSITLVGHSRGGLLVTRLAIELPERVSRLVIVSSATTAPAPPGQSDMAFYDAVEASAPADAEGVVAHYHAAQAVSEGPLSPEYLRIAGEMMESPKHKESVEGYRRNSADHWVPSLQRVKQQTLDHLDSTGLAVPTLVVWGKDDRSAPIALGHRVFDILARRTPDCAMVVVNRAGHQVFRDRPRFFENYGARVPEQLSWLRTGSRTAVGPGSQGVRGSNPLSSTLAYGTA